jgi:ribosomal protein S2
MSPSQGLYLHTGHRKIQNKRTQTFMHRVRFETTVPVFELAKTVHALDRAATVIGIS